jgi:phage terminase large subunit
MDSQLKLQTTGLFSIIAKSVADGARTLILQGGTSSGKTWSTLQFLFLFAIERAKLKRRTLISIVSESIPHLKRGCIRDFKGILGEHWDEDSWNATDRHYKIGPVTIEFFSADDSKKLRGGRRDVLFINEANNTTRASYDELSVRTAEFEILDFNPVYEFWAHSLIGQPGVVFSKSTYLDAKDVLPITTVQRIESRRLTDPNWWRVYGLGEIGNVEGLVHPLFDQVETMPESEGGVEFYGLDFGYSQDPASLVRCVLKGQDLFCDQLLYETGLTNDEIAARFVSLGLRKNFDEVFADAAEPKSIEEIRRYGFNIKPAPKGPGSIGSGIQRVNQYRQHWTKRSVDAIKEQRNYRYVEDGDGRITDKPVDAQNHCFAAGTLIETSWGSLPIELVQEGYLVLTRAGYRRVLRSWCTGTFQTYRALFSDGRGLVGTAGHPVYTARGFVPLLELTQADTFLTVSTCTSAGSIGSFVSSAGECLTRRLPTQSSAEATVRLVHRELASVQPVYNLSVDINEEYFANGILVHNCMDARRYACAGKLTAADRWATGSVFHAVPRTTGWSLPPEDLAYVEHLFGFSYANNRIYAIRTIWNAVAEQMYVAEYREFQTLKPLSDWVRQPRLLSSELPVYRSLASKEFGGESLRSLFLTCNSAEYRLKLEVMDDADDPGIVLYVNRMLSEGRLYASIDTQALSIMGSVTDTDGTFIKAFFPIIASLYKRVRNLPDQNRSIFHQIGEAKKRSTVSTNGFVEA